MSLPVPGGDDSDSGLDQFEIETRKAFEVAVERSNGSAMLDRECCEVGIGGQIAGATGAN